MTTGRDIYSISDWETITSQCTHNQESPSIQALTDAIKYYHELPKQDESTLKKRQNALASIVEICDQYITECGDDLYHKPQKSRKNLSSPIDSWIQSLQKKALQKIEYLNLLSSHLTNTKSRYLNRDDLINHLKERNQSQSPSRLKLFSGTLLEKIDPIHRQLEFNIHREPMITSGMNKAFFDWMHSESEVPFFLWIENHPILTANRVSEQKHAINLIDYQLADATNVKIEASNQQTQLVIDTNDKQQVALSTKRVKNYSFKMGTRYGSIAFTWCKEDENRFITHPHKAGQYHHSSLTKGKSVRCAGLWVVDNGLITAITNSSGHYRPSSLSFYLLIKFLLDKQLVNDQTEVADMLRPIEPINPLKPWGGNKSRYYPLDEYLAWAENLPAIQDYLAKNEVKAAHTHKINTETPPEERRYGW